jgi:hypothetical protein
MESPVLTLPKVVLSLVPMPLTAAMITTEFRAAMRPYSMAVAPLSSLANLIMRIFIHELHWHFMCRNCLSPLRRCTAYLLNVG